MKSDAIVGALKAAAKADIDVDDALDQLSELVELAHVKPHANPDVILSEVPVGPDTDSTVAVGWDTCASCKLAVSKCMCKNGPTEPDYVKKFRQDRPGFRMPTPVHSKSSEKSASRSSQIPVSSDGETQIDPDNITPGVSTEPQCSSCGQHVPSTAGDLNDDQSFTCHVCQEASK